MHNKRAFNEYSVRVQWTVCVHQRTKNTHSHILKSEHKKHTTVQTMCIQRQLFTFIVCNWMGLAEGINKLNAQCTQRTATVTLSMWIFVFLFRWLLFLIKYKCFSVRLYTVATLFVYLISSSLVGAYRRYSFPFDV